MLKTKFHWFSNRLEHNNNNNNNNNKKEAFEWRASRRIRTKISKRMNDQKWQLCAWKDHLGMKKKTETNLCAIKKARMQMYNNMLATAKLIYSPSKIRKQINDRQEKILCNHKKKSLPSKPNHEQSNALNAIVKW